MSEIMLNNLSGALDVRDLTIQPQIVSPKIQDALNVAKTMTVGNAMLYHPQMIMQI